MNLEEKTKVQHHYGLNTEPWVVSTFCGGYVQPDGSVGRLYEYNTEEEAAAAEALFHGEKNENR